MDEYRAWVDITLFIDAAVAMGVYAFAASYISARWRAWMKRRAERIEHEKVLIRTRRVVW